MMQKCPFASALITGLASCRHAEQVVRRGGSEYACRSAEDHAACVGLFDRLKAALHNCAQHGPTSQNRENRPDFRAYLQGQIAFVRSVNPQKAERLQRTFERIEWGS